MKSFSTTGNLKKAGFWTSTALLALGMLAGGIAQLIQAKVNADGMIHLGYPLYFMPILGTWKILGVIAILAPRFGLIKEWAYAGFFYAMSGAVISHVVTGDGINKWITPFIFLILVIVSRKLRPESRKPRVITSEAIS